MKAITLTQPWATLVAIGAKQIETRSFKTGHRGPLAIHAAKTFGVWGESGIRMLLNQYPSFQMALDSAGLTIQTLPMGCVIATCNLIDIVGTRVITHPPYEWNGLDGRLHRFSLSDQERDFGDYTPGRYAWFLADVQQLPQPIPKRGALSIWEWTQ